MKLIVRGADYGMTDSITDGCLKAIRDGILTDVGFMSNNNCADRAAKEIMKYPHISVGQDLNLVSGTPLSDLTLIPSLVNDEGNFISSVERKSKKLLSVPYDEVFIEMENQILKFIALFGKKPAYLVGHSFTCESIEKAMHDLSVKYEIEPDCFNSPNLITGKRWYFQNPEFDLNNKPIYSLQSQASTDVKSFIVNDKCEILNKEFAMIATHCGYCDGELINMSTFSIIRGIELEALCSKEVKDWIRLNEITLINFNQFLDYYREPNITL